MRSQKLTQHFTLPELTKTSCKLANSPQSPIIVSNLQAACLNILEPTRSHFKKPIIVHSGYRSPAVNVAVGGSKSSQHCSGEAVDFHVVGYSVYQVAQWISLNLLFDQLILENFVPNITTSGWVHCSFSKRNRKSRLTKFKGSNKYYPGIILHP